MKVGCCNTKFVFDFYFVNQVLISARIIMIGSAHVLLESRENFSSFQFFYKNGPLPIKVLI